MRKSRLRLALLGLVLGLFGCPGFGAALLRTVVTCGIDVLKDVGTALAQADWRGAVAARERVLGVDAVACALRELSRPPAPDPLPQSHAATLYMRPPSPDELAAHEQQSLIRLRAQAILAERRPQEKRKESIK